MAIPEPGSNDKMMVVRNIHAQALQIYSYAIPFTLTNTLPHTCRQVGAAIGHSFVAAGDAGATPS